MKNIFAVKMSAVAVAITLVMGCSSLNTSDAPAVSPEGMQLKKSTRSTIAYKKEGVNFADYNKVEISPSFVAFKKNWQRDYNRSEISLSERVSSKDLLRIKTDVASLFDETFKVEFSKSSDFSIVNNAGGKTLLIKPSVINLDVSAPDLKSAGLTKQYVAETGEATLFLEIYDSVSGEILARVIDEQTVGDDGYVQWATKVSNRADAKRTIQKWAKALRTNFDKAHAK